MRKDLEHINLYKNKEPEILKRPPSILVRIGTLAICTAISILFILTNYISLPHKVDTILIIENQQVHHIKAENDGCLKNIINQDSVRINEKIAELCQNDKKTSLYSDYDGFIVNKPHGYISFSKGEILFSIVPTQDNKVTSCFSIHYNDFREMQKRDTFIKLKGINRKFYFDILGEKHIKQDSMKIYIMTDSNILEYFSSNKDGSYSTNISLIIGYKSILKEYFKI